MIDPGACGSLKGLEKLRKRRDERLRKGRSKGKEDSRSRLRSEMRNKMDSWVGGRGGEGKKARPREHSRGFYRLDYRDWSWANSNKCHL